MRLVFPVIFGAMFKISVLYLERTQVPILFDDFNRCSQNYYTNLGENNEDAIVRAIPTFLRTRDSHTIFILRSAQQVVPRQL